MWNVLLRSSFSDKEKFNRASLVSRPLPGQSSLAAVDATFGNGFGRKVLHEQKGFT